MSMVAYGLSQPGAIPTHLTHTHTHTHTTGTTTVFLTHFCATHYGQALTVLTGSLEEFEFLATQGFVKLSAMQEMRQYPVSERGCARARMDEQMV